MDARELREGLEADYETELSRLGSSKAMYAVTGGEMETDAVLEAMAGRALAAAGTFEEWADAVVDVVVADALAGYAERERDHADRIADHVGAEPTAEVTPLQEYLRGLDTDAERAAGLLAWALVTDRTLSQAVGFFVGNADPGAADLFRDLREETAETLDGTLDLLDEVAEGEWSEAERAATGAVEVAYEDYAERLESMGIKVKPVC